MTDVSYANIKNELGKLLNFYRHSQTNKENFVLPKLPSDINSLYAKDPTIPPQIRKLKIVPTELYSVLDKFDLEPSKLTKREKELRKKYLRILLQFLNENYIQFLQDLNSNYDDNRISENEKQMVLQNFEATRDLTFRIINLLINEVDAPVKKTITTEGIIIIVLLGIIVIQCLNKGK